MNALAGLVKPLEWLPHEDIPGLHNAKGSDGWYYNIFEGSDGAFRYEPHPGTFPPPHPLDFPAIEAAKAAAQADYEARILSALNLPMLTALSEDASKAAELARALQVVSSVLQSERTRSGGQPFTGRWSIPSIDWRGTVSEALDLADAALDAKP